jgi:hypothetical protein
MTLLPVEGRESGSLSNSSGSASGPLISRDRVREITEISERPDSNRQ